MIEAASLIIFKTSAALWGAVGKLGLGVFVCLERGWGERQGKLFHKIYSDLNVPRSADMVRDLQTGHSILQSYHNTVHRI